MLADLEQRAVMARQEWRVRSADLTQVLRLDPRAVVVPLEHDHTQVTLIDPARALDDLMPIALANRPELAVAAGPDPGGGEPNPPGKVAPAPPRLSCSTASRPPACSSRAGIFGLGPNSSLNQWVGP